LTGSGQALSPGLRRELSPLGVPDLSKVYLE